MGWPAEMASSVKHVSPATLHALKEALTLAFWYKHDLRAFLTSALSDRALVAQFDWTLYKRSVVSQLVDSLAAKQDQYFDQLLSLVLSTADIINPSHLRNLEDGQRKYDAAKMALETLRSQVEPYRRLRDQEEEAERRRASERAAAEIRQAMSAKIQQLQTSFFAMLKLEPQRRGYELEKLLNELFAAFDVDAKGSFRVVGEQIDGAFTHDGTDFLLEAKWRNEPTPLADLDSFSMKVSRKLDNTLGLLLSMNGFQTSAVAMHSQSRPSVILMDGSDLSAVLEARIALPVLLSRKKQHAARTGETFLSAYQIVG